jgi:C4-dicarboxylate-specific signal transduction histidine kinase
LRSMSLGVERPRAWIAPPRLGRYVAIGLICGVLYVVVDQHMDAQLRLGTLPPVVTHLHNLIDFVLPILAGSLFGVSLHYLQQRAARARVEARRADDLHARLTRVERDQAVWVVVASTLHEIKNPLHALGLLLTEVTELRPDEQTARTDLLSRMSQQLGRIRMNVDALRSVSVRSTPKPERVDLSETAREVASALSHTDRALETAVSVHGAEHAVVRADPAHLRIILENLIKNALEAVEDTTSGNVALDVDIGGADVKVRVSDSGAGVPDELRAELFEPLATSKSRGLGLGLPIARALARAMGGDVVLEEGSGFVLSLPRVEA